MPTALSSVPIHRTLLTRRESADRLGCSERTIDNRIRAGSLRAVRNGRLVRIPVSEIERAEQEGI